MTPSARLLATALVISVPGMAWAGYRVVSPDEIDYHELEIEHNGSASFDRLPANSGAQSYTLELGTGPTPWWHTELELGFNRDPGFNEPTFLNQIVTENMVQLTEPGAAIADFGFYAEYGQTLTTGKNAGPNEITFGPVIGKDVGRWTHTVNLFLTRQLGPDQTTHGFDFSYAWQRRWNIWRPLSPAVEIYGDTGVIGSNPALSQQQLLVGPVGVGVLSFHDLGLGRAGLVKYEIGWLFGATRASPHGAPPWRLGVENP